jgi:hypothetical protein
MYRKVVNGAGASKAAAKKAAFNKAVELYRKYDWP